MTLDWAYLDRKDSQKANGSTLREWEIQKSVITGREQHKSALRLRLRESEIIQIVGKLFQKMRKTDKGETTRMEDSISFEKLFSNF